MPLNVLIFYPNKKGNKYAIVEASGEVIVDEYYNQLVTDVIKIVKIISFEELNNLCKNAVFNVKTGNYYFDENGEYHRENDLPAIEMVNGNKEWYKNGKLHRDNDFPAIENNKYKEWYQNGKLHRENDLPAVEHADGSKQWYINGNLHRDNDLPAKENSGSGKE